MPRRERRIHFYRVGGTDRDNEGRPLEFDAAPVLAAIEALPFTPHGDRYLEDPAQGSVYCAFLRPGDAAQLQMRFARVRRRELPLVDEQGTLTALDIPENAGLVEPIHVVFFPGNIVGTDFNFHGPRMGALRYYLWSRVPEAQQITFNQLLRRDALAELDRLGEVRLLSIKVRRAYFAQVRRASRSLADALETMSDMAGAEVIDVVLRSTPRSSRPLSNRLMESLRRLLQQEGVQAELDRLTIKGVPQEGAPVETVDLLRDQLVVSTRIQTLDDRSRTLDPDEAFRAVRQAFNEIRDELLEAAEVVE